MTTYEEIKDCLPAWWAPLVTMRDAQPPPRIYLACSGAGAGAAERLWSVPGCSAYLVGAEFPYATDATDAFLGFRPERYTSRETALDLASEAFMRAGAGPHAIGIGLTGSVASVEPHRGDHPIFAAWVSPLGCRVHSVVLEKRTGKHARGVDGGRADQLVLNALFDAVGLTVPALDVPSYVITEEDGPLRNRFFKHPHFRADGTRGPVPERLRAALPGTFDPLHEGHRGLAGAYEDASGHRPTFWVTAEPPHKDPAPTATLLRRARALRGESRLFTRGEPLYLDKARKFPGCAFVVGADAFERLCDPKWGPKIGPMFEEFRKLGTRFHVAERHLNGAPVPLRTEHPNVATVSCVLPGRWDVSSTALRARERE